ncbi:hypothetical protein GLOTRDRAFT_114059 [Gloeophyllum trabeum ATCC 11539]|uniref:C3H1-type domain-containing protein n=1 Tax=Gloeophyllum trabeum (strain ATCC 11539 / FP-39264 / Madison 617) TaxID=670483 RepID=S7S0S9_GLOTA|nr:uncharacterized protein GLOTRDRAFT_114059 [Gloeophyllum trabeum ATCC 11539]EPQ59339.1 hypothetical protein GLOTRDRAFT_114059 [Gloeophyllum trabeum ATCC 11539]
MASTSSVEATKQLWDDTLARLLNLSTATVTRNTELQARLNEAELELSVWKQAHSAALDSAERDRKAHMLHVATLNSQIASLQEIGTQSPLMLCIIDGDGNIFSPNLLTQGVQGGRQAAQELTRGIAGYIQDHDLPVGTSVVFSVVVFFNRKGLLDTLVSHGICTTEQFEAFFLGFGQASPRFWTVDVGIGREPADTKIKDYLQTYGRFPQTLRIIFGGGHDNAYMPTLTAMENEQLLGKVVILQGCDDLASEIRSLDLPILRIDGLFMEHKLSSASKKPGPIPLGGLWSITTNGGLLSPRSPPVCSPSELDGRFIDPSRVKSPPPCNEHYLMSCSKGGSCKYSHDYILTPDQLGALARNAKKAPCNYLKNGLTCPHGDRCCWGHKCPNGPSCFHLSKGKCWFKGDAMHSPVD